ncbi:hypothetical protein [Rhodococcus sp. NPDC055024]
MEISNAETRETEMDTVTITATDLEVLSRKVKQVRQEHRGVSVQVYIAAAIAREVSVARSCLVAGKVAVPTDVIRYVGTPRGLVGLLNDMHTLSLADSVIIRPLLSMPEGDDLFSSDVLPLMRAHLPQFEVLLVDGKA